jgi:hypothetical protein
MRESIIEQIPNSSGARITSRNLRINKNTAV